MARFSLPFSKKRARSDAAEELRLHIEGRVEELMQSGLSRAEAEIEAIRRFGDPAAIESAIQQIDVATHRRREVREVIADALHDLKLSARSLTRRPAFAIGVILTLALGIGANTAIFSVADALLFRPPPYPHPEQLVSVWGPASHAAGEYFAYRERMKSFSAMGTYSEWQMTIGNDGGSFRVDGSDLSANMFDLLGVRAAIGATFEPNANDPGAPRTVVLSHTLWRSRFGGDSSIIGKSLLFEGTPRTIVGVMPEDFHFPQMGTQLWIPSGYTPANAGNHWGWWKYWFAARLKPGVSAEAAQRELVALAPEVRKLNPLWDPGETYGQGATVTLLQSRLSGPARTTMYVLLGVVFALLLVACANVANLVLVRAMAREREFALRAALGSSRRRMIAQLLGENFILAFGGGLLAVALAWIGVRALSASLPAQLLRESAVSVDSRVLAVTIALVFFAWIAFGLFPALRGSLTNPGKALQGSRGSTKGASQHRVAGALTVVQLALAVMLVIGSGLLLRSLDALRRVDPGFRGEQVLVARVTMPTGTYRDTLKRAAFVNALLPQVRALAGVTSAGLVDRPPLRGPVYGLGARIEGIAEDFSKQLPTINHGISASPGFFETMGIRIVNGRSFTEADGANAPWVVIISKSVADRFWPGLDPIGKHVGLPFASPWMTVVGVAADVKEDSLNGPRNLAIYRPYAQNTSTDLTIVAKASVDAGAFGRAVTAAVNQLDPSVPVSDVRSMSSIVDASLARAKFTTYLLGGFALLALALGAVGIYGVVSYNVSERTRELGLRVALGATPVRVLAFVMGHGGRLAALGVAIGVVGALGAARALSGLLYSVSQTDLVTFTVAPIALLLVALVATWIPARRAVRADPLTSLRTE